MIRIAPCLLLLAPLAAAAGCPPNSVPVDQGNRKVFCRCVDGFFRAGQTCVPARYERSWAPETRRDLERGLQSIPHEAFKRWVSANVTFQRVSRGMMDSPLAADRGGVIHVYDPFATLDDARRRDLLAFEIGRALWYQTISNEPRGEHTARSREFMEIYRRHEAAIGAMHFGGLVDNDPQAQFAYTLRAVVLNLGPPATAPSEIRDDWERTKQEVRVYLEKLLREPPAGPR